MSEMPYEWAVLLSHLRALPEEEPEAAQPGGGFSIVNVDGDG